MERGLLLLPCSGLRKCVLRLKYPPAKTTQTSTSEKPLFWDASKASDTAHEDKKEIQRFSAGRAVAVTFPVDRARKRDSKEKGWRHLLTRGSRLQVLCIAEVLRFRLCVGVA